MGEEDRWGRRPRGRYFEQLQCPWDNYSRLSVLSLPWFPPAAFVPLLPSPPFGRVLRGKAEGELTGVPQVGAGGDCVGFGRQAQSTWGGRGGQDVSPLCGDRNTRRGIVPC